MEFDALSLNGVGSECISNAASTEITKDFVFLKAYPNPSNKDLFIESNKPIDLLEIKDLSGRVLLEMVPQKRRVHIQISQLKNTYCFLNCLIDQEWVSRKIILNQR